MKMKRSIYALLVISYIFMFIFSNIDTALLVFLYNQYHDTDLLMERLCTTGLISLLFILLSVILMRLYTKELAVSFYSITLFIFSLFVIFYKRSGIIDLAWLFAMTMSVSIILYFNLVTITSFNSDSNKVSKIADSALQLEYLREFHHDIVWYLTKSLQAIFTLAAVTGVAMSILFQGGYDDIILKPMAAKMVIAFASIFIISSYYLFIPLVKLMRKCRNIIYNIDKNEGHARKKNQALRGKEI